MDYAVNEELCHCKHVSMADIDRALHQNTRFSDVEREFEDVQRITSCATARSIRRRRHPWTFSSPRTSSGCWL